MNFSNFPLPKSVSLVSGLAASSKALYLLSLDKPFITVSKTEEEALRLYEDIEFFAGVLGKEPPVFLPVKEAGLSSRRLQAVETILEQSAVRVVTNLEAAYSSVWSAEEFRRASLKIRVGEETGLEFLTELLREMGYLRLNLVAENGEFAIRGGIVDIYPAAQEHPFRIEFFGDEIESIRAFDVDTQRSFRTVDELIILPIREPEGEVKNSLFDVLPDHLVIADGTLPDAESLHVSLTLESLRIDGEGLAFDIKSVEGMDITARQRRLTGETLHDIGPKLLALSQQYNLLIASRSLGEAERVSDLLAEADVIAPVIEPQSIPGYSGRIALTRGKLSSGFLDPEAGLLVITTEELFGAKTHYKERKKSRVSNLLQSIDDLSDGDLVVHMDHGVGRFLGMKKITVEDFEGDFLHLEYAGGSKLYLPVDSIGKIRKYHAAGDSRAGLARLGGKAWEKTKAKVRGKVKELAGDLIKIYAQREACEGFSFSPDSEFHREFADAFPFEETPDQSTSINDIAADMESSKPMDRLLCGDVGYGKTEVAMRAAFKAVFDGKQVAILAPTTILAEQHYENFTSRFSAFSVNIDYLSRFKNRPEQKETLKRLADSEIDILIGTHRLLAKDVVFPDLGLLVIDEEHKFGVAHKEKIKTLKENVDVLTLSATPIPRTLHMALSGIRGISTIETPPEERLAVKTLVSRYNPEVIREALERELARGGQAFFVHNRIKTIYKTGAFLQGLVPGIKIGVAHGRMNEKELEQVMHEFYQGDLDLLLCTSIISSGLDIPRANTIILDRADMFGLADLYQLKGRVGRSDVRAFAYFLIPGEDILTTEAKKRLQAIQELSFLGAGVRLAMKDLEIRGGGNLLGGQQSGHIEAVGYDFYVEMLESAVAELKGTETRSAVEPVMEMQLNAFIPETYLDDTTLRFTLYRRISAARRSEALSELRREIRDRFGPLPEELTCLLDVMELKNLAREAGVEKLRQSGEGFYRILMSQPPTAAPEAIIALAKETNKTNGKIRFLPEGGLELILKKQDWQTIFQRLKTLLTALARKD